ncbi:LOW QUALITY PROTEIN: solute carrier family 22 member 2-like [Aegotheles albertisi]
MPSLDDILEQIGESDFFQKQALFVLCLLSAAFTPVYVGVVFFGFIPEHRCFSPGVAELSQRCGWSLEEQLNLTVPEWSSHGGSFGSRCRRYEVDWNTTGVSCTNSIGSLVGNQSTVPLGPCQDGWVYDSPGTSLVTEFNLVCEDSWKLDLFQSCMNAGVFIGSVSIVYIADRYVVCRQVFGCKFCLLVTVLVNAVAGVLMAFVPSYSWTVIFCLVQGLVSNGSWLTVYVLISESVGSNYRRAVGIAYQLAFSMGLLLLTALVYALPHWSWFQLTVTLPNFFFLLYYWKIFIAVLTTLSPAHCNLLSCCLCFQNLSSEDEDGEKLKPSFLDLVRTPQIRKHTFILMYSWQGKAFAAQMEVFRLHLHAILSAQVHELRFLYSALVEFPATFILMITLVRIGRRYPWAEAYMMAGSACLLTDLVPETVSVRGLLMSPETLTPNGDKAGQERRKETIIYLHVLTSKAAPKATSSPCFTVQHASLPLRLTATLNINWGSGQSKTGARSLHCHTRKKSWGNKLTA